MIYASTTIPEIVKQARKDQKLSQEELATASGLSTPYISMIETGKKQPTVKSVKKIANGLGLKLVFTMFHPDDLV